MQVGLCLEIPQCLLAITAAFPNLLSDLVVFDWEIFLCFSFENQCCCKSLMVSLVGHFLHKILQVQLRNEACVVFSRFEFAGKVKSSMRLLITLVKAKEDCQISLSDQRTMSKSLFDNFRLP